MSTITYNAVVSTRTAVPAAAPVRKADGFFSRLYTGFMEARQRQATAELRRHAILLPHELEQAGWKINERSEDSLPFLR